MPATGRRFSGAAALPIALAMTALTLLASDVRAAAPVAPRAEVIHWWTSGGEAAAVRALANAYRAAGGVWVDTAIAGGEQARAVAISRIVGNDAPAAALFNTSRQFRDLIDQGLLITLDDVAHRENWETILPEPMLNSVRVGGHYYAAPVSLHMPTWIWYSQAALRKAGVAAEPHNFDELFMALDKLRAAGLIPLAHGGQSWQDSIVFRAVLANLGGRELYLRVVRDRDPRAIASREFRQVLTTFKRLHSYIDAGSPGRNWNDATALLITGRAGFQIMGDWVKAEFASAGQLPGRDFGCIPGFGPHSPYLIQGDAFVFPRSDDPQIYRARHATGLQRAQGFDSDPRRRRCHPARSLRAAGSGDHEGSLAPGGERRGLSDAGPEWRDGRRADRVLESRYRRGRRAAAHRRRARRLGSGPA